MAKDHLKPRVQIRRDLNPQIFEDLLRFPGKSRGARIKSLLMSGLIHEMLLERSKTLSNVAREMAGAAPPVEESRPAKKPAHKQALSAGQQKADGVAKNSVMQVPNQHNSGQNASGGERSATALTGVRGLEQF